MIPICPFISLSAISTLTVSIIRASSLKHNLTARPPVSVGLRFQAVWISLSEILQFEDKSSMTCIVIRGLINLFSIFSLGSFAGAFSAKMWVAFTG